MRWISLRPGFIPLWYDDDVDIDDWKVETLEEPLRLVRIARVLLGEGDPAGLGEFDALYHEGWRDDPPQWTGERLRRFSAAAGRLPDPMGPVEGYWTLSDDTVVDLLPKLPWSKRFIGHPVAEARRSIVSEWRTARQLHHFLADAVAAGNEVVSD